MENLLSICLAAICVGGVLLNMIVFWRYKISRTLRESSIKTSMELLFFMSLADSLSLLSLLFMLVSATEIFTIDEHSSDKEVTLSDCKLDIFVIHSASAFSIWCWFLLSALRYLAIYKPYLHLRLDFKPRIIAGATALVCTMLEVWIFFDVAFDEDKKICAEPLPVTVSNFFQLSDICWSYFVPVSLITILDIKVLYMTWNEGRSYLNIKSVGIIRNPVASMEAASAESIIKNKRKILLRMHHQWSVHTLPSALGGDNNDEKEKASCCGGSKGGMMGDQRRQQIRLLRRFFLISLLDLGMNLPNYAIRLYIILAPVSSEEAANSKAFNWAQDLSQLLYFSQFALNALYLAMITYALPSPPENSKQWKQQASEKSQCSTTAL